MILWTLEEAQSLAPDKASLKAAEKLLNPAKWQGLSEAENTLWGKCKGSGARPYEVHLDKRQRRGACTCPSRKQPCKHIVALAQMGVQARMLFSPDELPKHIHSWLSKAEKTKQSTKSKEESASPRQNLSPEELQAQQARYDQQRFAQIEQGILECERWLNDVLREGVADLSRNTLQGFDYMAARLVDTKAPALGRKIKKLGQILREKKQGDWPARAAEFLGQIFLILQAYHQYESLSPLLKIDLKNQLGWAQRQKDFEDLGADIESWWVIGQIEQGESDLRVRRSWVYSLETQRIGLILDFSFRNQGFEQAYLPGKIYRAQGIYFPASVPQRLFLRCAGVKHAQDLEVFPEIKNTLKQCLMGWSQALGKNPWLEQWPFLLSGVHLQRHQEQYCLIDSSEDCIEVKLSEKAFWQAQALSGGQACTVFAEWNGREFVLLSLFSKSGFCQFNQDLGETHELPELSSKLLKPLLMGQGRQAWQGQFPEYMNQLETTQLQDFQSVLSHHYLLQRAGRKLPGEIKRTQQMQREPAPAPKRPVLHRFNENLWQAIFNQDPMNVCALLQEYLDSKHSLPAVILPLALDWFSQNPLAMNQTQIQQLLDERGLWLAGQHEQWQSFQTTTALEWNPELLISPEAFKLWQINHESQALKTLQKHWSKLTTAQRIKYINTMQATAVSEPFLEQCLDERQPVREAAALCLSRSPQTQLTQRMMKRARALLRIQNDAIEVSLPKTGAMQLDWGRDGLNITGRQLSGDERKRMLFDLFCSLPLSFWRNHLPNSSRLELWKMIWRGKQIPLIAAFLNACIQQAEDPIVQELLIDILKCHFQSEFVLPQIPYLSKRQVSEINLSALFAALSADSQTELLSELQDLNLPFLTDDLADLMPGLVAPLQEAQGRWLGELYFQRCRRILWQIQDAQIPNQALTKKQHQQFAKCYPQGLLDQFQRTLRDLCEWFEAFLFDPGSWADKGLSPQDLQSIRGAQSPAKKTQAAIMANLQIMHERSSLRKELFS